MVYVRHQISVTSTVRKETQVWGGTVLTHHVCVCVWWVGVGEGGWYMSDTRCPSHRLCAKKHRYDGVQF